MTDEGGNCSPALVLLKKRAIITYQNDTLNQTVIGQAFTLGERAMQNIQGVELDCQTREEHLPDFSADFPYIATRSEPDQYEIPVSPWHWHKPVELFYIESGTLEYETPNEKIVFFAGSGGMVNSNVLHKTRTLVSTQRNIQLLHIFDPSFLSGRQGSRIEQRYFLPLLSNPQLEILPLRQDVPEQADVLHLIRDAFCLQEGEVGFEIKMERALLEIWLLLYQMFCFNVSIDDKHFPNIDAIKAMMLFIREHYQNAITIRELAESAYISERECYRVFRDCLHTTPAGYIISYRLQEACQLLREGKLSITEIAHACGFGTSSYLGKAFLRRIGCTPKQYRKGWQDKTKERRD